MVRKIYLSYIQPISDIIHITKILSTPKLNYTMNTLPPLPTTFTRVQQHLSVSYHLLCKLLVLQKDGSTLFHHFMINASDTIEYQRLSSILGVLTRENIEEKI